MSFMDRIKAMFSGGSAAESHDHAHDHDHDHGHDHSHEPVADTTPAAPVDPLGTGMPESSPGVVDADDHSS